MEGATIFWNIFSCVCFLQLALYIDSSRAFDLCTCNQLTCDVPNDCKHGLVPDQCGCCEVCARGVYEECGGAPDGTGVCAAGLQCVIDARAGDLVTGRERGTCQEIDQNCDASICDSIATHRCPSDSVLVYNGTQEDNVCCKTTYECRCDMSVCKVPKCAAGYLAQIIRHSNHRPGSCCDLYHCKVEGCRSIQGQVYKSGETWRESDCVTCNCVDGKKECQAEMCVKTCLNPVYIPGRCCPMCESPSIYPPQPSERCQSLTNCNISCQTGLKQAPDGCHVCKCKPRGCMKDCRYGYVHDELGNEVCQCLTLPSHCPDLATCSKQCNNGFKMSKKNCPKCRCNKCETLSCNKTCHHGYQTDRNGCQECKCQESLWERNCTVNMTEYTPGQTWTGSHCDQCTCIYDGTVKCEPLTCPVQNCLIMVKKEDECCPVCLNTSLAHINTPPASSHSNDQDSQESDQGRASSVDIERMEQKYIIALAIVGTMVAILLVLVFILLYMKLKQRHQASWSVAGGQDMYCKCPLFIGQSPALQHKYNLNTTPDIPAKLAYNTVHKYDQTYVDSSLKSEAPLDEQHAFIPATEKGKDFINEDDTCDTIESKCQFKNWSSA